jgi:phage gpG-like protein
MALGKPFSGVKAGMSGAGLIDVDIVPLPIILVGQFEALAASVRSYHEPLKRSIQQVVIPSIKKNFDVGGRPSWPVLAPATLVFRGELKSTSSLDALSAGFGSEILVRSGKLRRAAQALARWTITRDEAYAGGAWPGSVWYGPLQHTGFIGGHGAETPPRPFMMIQEEDMPKIEEVFVQWFKERLIATGFTPGSED